MIRLRPVTDKDLTFIETVYRSTREKQLGLDNWPELQREAFFRMQSIAQDAEYKRSFPNAAFEIIEYNKKAAGRLYTGETAREIRLIDISLLPDFRGKGLGTKILKGLIKRAHDNRKLLTLHVEPDNLALQLYLKLGFEHIRNNGRQYYLELDPIDEQKKQV